MPESGWTVFMRRDDIIHRAVLTLEALVSAHGEDNAFAASEVSGGHVYPFQVGRYGPDIAAQFNSRNRRLRAEYRERWFHIRFIEA